MGNLLYSRKMFCIYTLLMDTKKQTVFTYQKVTGLLHFSMYIITSVRVKLNHNHFTSTFH